MAISLQTYFVQVAFKYLTYTILLAVNFIALKAKADVPIITIDKSFFESFHFKTGLEYYVFSGKMEKLNSGVPCEVKGKLKYPMSDSCGSRIVGSFGYDGEGEFFRLVVKTNNPDSVEALTGPDGKTFKATIHQNKSAKLTLFSNWLGMGEELVPFNPNEKAIQPACKPGSMQIYMTAKNDKIRVECFNTGKCYSSIREEENHQKLPNCLDGWIFWKNEKGHLLVLPQGGFEGS